MTTIPMQATVKSGAGAAILSVGALLASVALLLTGHGLLQTLLPIRAGLENFASLEIGLLGSSYFAGYVIGCLTTPLTIIRCGHVRTFAALVAVASSASLMHAMVVDPYAWMACRFVTGICLAGLYLVIESWLNERATNETRGAIMAAYVTVNLLVITAGQMIVPFFVPDSFVPLSVAAILIALAALPVALTTSQQPAPITLVRFRPKALFALSPVGVVGIALIGASNGAFWTLGPVYGVAQGFSIMQIAVFMSLVVIGGAVSQYPVGVLSDRVDRRIVLAGLSICAIGLGALLSGTVPLGDTARLVVSFAFGAAILPTYAVAAAHVYDHATSEGYVEVSASLLLLNGLGSVAGPIVAAMAMQAYGPGSLFAWIAAVYGMMIAFLAFRMTRRAAPEDKQKFSLPNTAPVVVIGDAAAVEESPLVLEPGAEEVPLLEEVPLSTAYEPYKSIYTGGNSDKVY